MACTCGGQASSTTVTVEESLPTDVDFIQPCAECAIVIAALLAALGPRPRIAFIPKR